MKNIVLAGKRWGEMREREGLGPCRDEEKMRLNEIKWEGNKKWNKSKRKEAKKWLEVSRMAGKEMWDVKWESEVNWREEGWEDEMRWGIENKIQNMERRDGMKWKIGEAEWDVEQNRIERRGKVKRREIMRKLWEGDKKKKKNEINTKTYWQKWTGYSSNNNNKNNEKKTMKKQYK